ncbi:MAG: clostripain-related cysteine peptidase, partial [Candidatus Eremiobacterota bacterium]
MHLTPGQPAPRVREWTVLCYNAGHRDESKMCTSSLVDLERVGSDDSVQIVAMNYRSPWLLEGVTGFNQDYRGARTYAVERHEHREKAGLLTRLLPADFRAAARFMLNSPRDLRSPVLERQRLVNMGEAGTLKRFLLENMARYPARRYAVILSGHGAAFGGQMIVHSPEGRISNEALGKTLDEVAAALGRKIDLVNLNTCFGANLETLYPLRRSVETVVASQDLVFAATQPLARVMESLQAVQGRLDGAELGRLCVGEARRQPLGGLFTGTLSAVDMGKLEAVTTAVNSLQQAVLDEGVPPATLKEAYEASLRFTYSNRPRRVDLTDAGSFARELSRRVESPAVHGAAQDLQRALKDCVLAEQHADAAQETLLSKGIRFLLRRPTPGPRELSGLTLYLDPDANHPDSRLDQIVKTEYASAVNAQPFLRWMGRAAEEERARRGPV